MLGDSEVSLFDGKTADVNFHSKTQEMKEQYEISATEGHFAPFLKRIEKID